MRFLCLHGFGTNNQVNLPFSIQRIFFLTAAQVFKVQTGTYPRVVGYFDFGLTYSAALRYELTNHDDHSFEFVQGVVPVSKPEGRLAENEDKDRVADRRRRIGVRFRL